MQIRSYIKLTRTLLIIYSVLLIYISPSAAQIEDLNFSIEKSDTEKIDSNKISDNREESAIDEDKLIHSGDLIDIDILGSTEYDWRGKVTPEGFLSGLNFVENIYVRCKTEKNTADEIAQLYTKFLRNPKVKVKILDRSSRPVSSLLGAVKIPQNYQLKRKINLNELIIISGGLTEEANGEIQILRRQENSCTNFEEKESSVSEVIKVADKEITDEPAGGLKIINIKVSDLLAGTPESNPQIHYGDIITVQSAEPVYVIGGVGKPGRILFRKDLTVSRAISIAGGLSKKSDSEQIRIFRREGADTKILDVNLELIKAKEKDDILLQAYDIIDVSGKGSERKYPPDLDFENNNQTKNSKLPLRVID